MNKNLNWILITHKNFYILFDSMFNIFIKGFLIDTIEGEYAYKVWDISKLYFTANNSSGPSNSGGASTLSSLGRGAGTGAGGNTGPGISTGPQTIPSISTPDQQSFLWLDNQLENLYNQELQRRIGQDIHSKSVSLREVGVLNLDAKAINNSNIPSNIKIHLRRLYEVDRFIFTPSPNETPIKKLIKNIRSR